MKKEFIMTTLKNSYSHTYATSKRATIDLSLSGNPLGASPKTTEAIVDATRKLHIYPDEEKTLITLIARHHHIAEESILLGAGANQLLEDFLKVFALRKNIVVPSATFPESIACMATLQGSVKKVPLKDNFSMNLNGLLKACTADTALIHLCNPNNPTGLWTESNQLLQLAEQSPVPLLISEAGADFVGQSMIGQSCHSKIIVVRSFSKAYGLAGLRIGYSVASPKIIAVMKSNLRSYGVSSLAIAAAIVAMQDQDHLRKSVAYILQEKAWLMREMDTLDFITIPSQGQTFIAQIPKKFGSANQFCAIAKEYDMAVVNCSLYPGLDQYIRISPQNHKTNKKFISILKKMTRRK
jgi:histidinol-phosphate aminotransferase